MIILLHIMCHLQLNLQYVNKRVIVIIEHF